MALLKFLFVLAVLVAVYAEEQDMETAEGRKRVVVLRQPIVYYPVHHGYGHSYGHDNYGHHGYGYNNHHGYGHATYNHGHGYGHSGYGHNTYGYGHH